MSTSLTRPFVNTIDLSPFTKAPSRIPGTGQVPTESPFVIIHIVPFFSPRGTKAVSPPDTAAAEAASG